MSLLQTIRFLDNTANPSYYEIHSVKKLWHTKPEILHQVKFACIFDKQPWITRKRWFRYLKWVLWLNKNTWILLLLFFHLITCLKWSIKWFINSNPKLPPNWNKNYLLPFWKQFLNRTFDMQLQKRLIIFYTQHTIHNTWKLKSPWNSRDTSFLVRIHTLKTIDVLKHELVLQLIEV